MTIVGNKDMPYVLPGFYTAQKTDKGQRAVMNDHNSPQYTVLLHAQAQSLTDVPLIDDIMKTQWQRQISGALNAG